MKYPLEKYKYHIWTSVEGKPYGVTACSTYAGKTVKGTAKCDPRDEFDLETGKKLAAARCSVRIANKRVARASKKYLEAADALYAAQVKFENMRQYYMDAVDQADEAAEELRGMLTELKGE